MSQREGKDTEQAREKQRARERERPTTKKGEREIEQTGRAKKKRNGEGQTRAFRNARNVMARCVANPEPDDAERERKHETRSVTHCHDQSKASKIIACGLLIHSICEGQPVVTMLVATCTCSPNLQCRERTARPLSCSRSSPDAWLLACPRHGLGLAQARRRHAPSTQR